MAKKANAKRTAPISASALRKNTSVPARSGDEPYMPPDGKPRFLFQRLDLEYDGNWSWEQASADTLRQILRFLGEMERLTWGEIAKFTYSGNRSGTHQKHKLIAVENLCADAQRRIQQRGLLPTVESLFEFRVGSKQRLWGYPRQEGFYVLWWDPKHQVYPVEPP